MWKFTRGYPIYPSTRMYSVHNFITSTDLAISKYVLISLYQSIQSLPYLRYFTRFLLLLNHAQLWDSRGRMRLDATATFRLRSDGLAPQLVDDALLLRHFVADDGHLAFSKRLGGLGRTWEHLGWGTVGICRLLYLMARLCTRYIQVPLCHYVINTGSRVAKWASFRTKQGPSNDTGKLPKDLQESANIEHVSCEMCELWDTMRMRARKP